MERMAEILFLFDAYLFLSFSFQRLQHIKPCPHCRRKVRLSQKTARQRRQSPISATVALQRQCGQAFALLTFFKFLNLWLGYNIRFAVKIMRLNVGLSSS